MVFFEKWLFGDDKITWFVWLFYLAALIGAWKLIKFILSPFLTCFSHWCKRPQDLKKKYGRPDNSAYAVVTGGSDGIGLELCN